ncbi:MAG: hypothetical protein FWG12_07725 [Holophagaceae bacterium]|nr:hypothetical protein [Holophagaceae bacterium]
MKTTYELRLYDKRLMTFSLEESGIKGLVAEVAEVASIDKGQNNLLPLGLEPTPGSLLKWLRQRIIPKNRAFVHEILKSLNLSPGNVKGIIDICKVLSLNDSYWIVPQGFSGCFSEYNLYQNPFSELLALVAYTGIGQSQMAFSTSPELTTEGMLPKAWRQIENDGIYLYKGGYGAIFNMGKEPYSEYYASQIAHAMGLNAVKYDLEVWKNILASKCRLFTDIDTAFVPAGKIIKSGGLKECFDCYASLGNSFLEDLKSMLVFDAVIYNEDRHFGNFGILRDSRSGAIISTAPLFDHGLSLFNFASDEDVASLDEYAKTRRPAYPDITFETICTEAIGKTQLAQLEKLSGFKFIQHSSINLPNHRLDAIQRHIQRRVGSLLKL